MLVGEKPAAGAAEFVLRATTDHVRDLAAVAEKDRIFAGLGPCLALHAPCATASYAASEDLSALDVHAAIFHAARTAAARTVVGSRGPATATAGYNEELNIACAAHRDADLVPGGELVNLAVGLYDDDAIAAGTTSTLWRMAGPAAIAKTVAPVGAVQGSITAILAVAAVPALRIYELFACYVALAPRTTLSERLGGTFRLPDKTWATGASARAARPRAKAVATATDIAVALVDHRLVESRDNNFTANGWVVLGKEIELAAEHRRFAGNAQVRRTRTARDAGILRRAVEQFHVLPARRNILEMANDSRTLHFCGGDDVSGSGPNVHLSVRGERILAAPHVVNRNSRACGELDLRSRAEERGPERVCIILDLAVAAKLGYVRGVLARLYHPQELGAVKNARQDSDAGEHALRVGERVELALPASSPVGVVVCVVAVFKVSRRDDVASPDEADKIVAQGEVRDLHYLRLRPVAPDCALWAEDEFVAGVQREVRVAEDSPCLAKRPEHARRLAVGVQLRHCGKALGFYAKLVDEREVEPTADERGDLFRRGRAVAYHDALIRKFLSHALAEFRAEEHLPVSALLRGKVWSVEVPATVFAADGLLVPGHLTRQITPSLLMEKLDHIAVRELLEGLAIALYAPVEFLDEIGVCLRGIARIVGPLRIRRTHRHLPGLAFLLALDRREPGLAIARLEHHVKLLLGMRV